VHGATTRKRSRSCSRSSISAPADFLGSGSTQMMASARETRPRNASSSPGRQFVQHVADHQNAHGFVTRQKSRGSDVAPRDPDMNAARPPRRNRPRAQNGPKGRRTAIWSTPSQRTRRRPATPASAAPVQHGQSLVPCRRPPGVNRAPGRTGRPPARSSSSRSTASHFQPIAFAEGEIIFARSAGDPPVGALRRRAGKKQFRSRSSAPNRFQPRSSGERKIQVACELLAVHPVESGESPARVSAAAARSPAVARRTAAIMRFLRGVLRWR